MLDKLFGTNGSKNEKKIQEISLKNAELENKLLKNSVELEQIKTQLKDAHISLQLILSSYQGLAEEVGSLHDVLYALMAPTANKNAFRFSFRDRNDDPDDDDNWN